MQNISFFLTSCSKQIFSVVISNSNCQIHQRVLWCLRRWRRRAKNTADSRDVIVDRLPKNSHPIYSITTHNSNSWISNPYKGIARTLYAPRSHLHNWQLANWINRNDRNAKKSLAEAVKIYDTIHRCWIQLLWFLRVGRCYLPRKNNKSL